ncbi:MAG: spore coat protein CotH, partial [Limisphaerales bacterium]
MNVLFKILARIVCLWGCVSGGIAVEAVSPKTAAAFFQDTKVWDVVLTVSPENYAALEPRNTRGFGADFEYVRANATVAGKALENVGLRYKGNSSFSTARGIPKKSFKIDFNRFVKGQKFVGLTKL